MSKTTHDLLEAATAGTFDQSSALDEVIDRLTYEDGDVTPDLLDEAEDAISEMADNLVPVYTSDLLDWYRNEEDGEVAEAYAEFGPDGLDDGDPIPTLIARGAYLAAERLLYLALAQVRAWLDNDDE